MSMKKILLLVAIAVTACGSYAAERGALDIEFVKGLIAIPSESRSIPECNRATAYLKDYLESVGFIAMSAEQKKDVMPCMPPLCPGRSMTSLLSPTSM